MPLLGHVFIHDRFVPVYGRSVIDFALIRDAARVMNALVPWAARHFARVIRRIVVWPGICDDGGDPALACTAGRMGRVAALNVLPSNLGLLETIISLLHEGLHWRITRSRRVVSVPEHRVEPYEDLLYEQLLPHIAW
jgi:hypothetical protein